MHMPKENMCVTSGKLDPVNTSVALTMPVRVCLMPMILPAIIFAVTPFHGTRLLLDTHCAVAVAEEKLSHACNLQLVHAEQLLAFAHYQSILKELFKLTLSRHRHEKEPNCWRVLARFGPHRPSLFPH